MACALATLAIPNFFSTTATLSPGYPTICRRRQRGRFRRPSWATGRGSRERAIPTERERWPGRIKTPNTEGVLQLDDTFVPVKWFHTPQCTYLETLTQP